MLRPMRLRLILLVATSTSVGWLAGCSSDTPAAGKPAATVAPPSSEAPTATVCASNDAGETPTVTIDVDDGADGLGRFGLRTPDPLPPGPVRLVVNSVKENTHPIDVTITHAGATMFEFVQVGSGVLCAADLTLASGDYTVTSVGKTKTFTVAPQP